MSDARTSATPGDAIAGVAFSREELYVMLRLLKASSLPGFDTAWTRTGASGEPAAELIAVAQAGANALIARGYVTIMPTAPGGVEPVAGIAAPALALVGASAFSAYTLRIAGLAGGEYREFYLSQLGAIGALHWTPSLNIHVFMPLAGRAGVLKAATSLVGMDDGATVATGAQLGAIPLDALRPALEAARIGDAGGVQRALSRVAMTTPGALQGIESALLRDPVMTQVTVGTHTTTGSTTERSAFTLGSPAGSYLLTPTPEDPTLLAIYSCDVRRITQWLTAQLPQ